MKKTFIELTNEELDMLDCIDQELKKFICEEDYEKFYHPVMSKLLNKSLN